MPTCRTGHKSTHSLTQLLLVRSQIDRHHAWGAQHSHRVTTITLNGTHYFVQTLKTSLSTIEQISHQLLRSSATKPRTHVEIVSSLHSTSTQHQLNLNWISTAKISSYSLASTFPLYREISINSYDVGYFKSEHPTTVQVFIRLHKYTWR